MKVAVTSQGKSLSSPVDPRFGRARWFIVVDTDNMEFEVFDNSQNMNAMQGAGVQAAENVAGLSVEYLITGHCGPKAFHGLSAAGIKIIVGASGTVSEAIEKFKNNELQSAERPDVQGHWS